ncbi:MAG: hypothetical protein MZV64_16765 [Ignavibacteriales bacterium]|nr:hypothetical protein [Ignavibacteriales bacterium]
MFKKVLIANRGEIALRVIRACKRARASRRSRSTPRPTANGLHVRFADEARVHRAAAAARELPQHPGASSARPRSPAPTRSTPATASSPRTPTSPRSARRATSRSSAPAPQAIRLMGDKAAAQEDDDARPGVPVVPGSRGRRRGARRRRSRSRSDDRLPGDHQGRRRRRRPRDARRPRRRRTSRSTTGRAQAEAEAAFGVRRRLHREVRRAAAPHRDPGAGGPARATWCTSASASAPIQRRHQKLDRGGALAGRDARSCARRMGRAGGRGGARRCSTSSAGTIEFLLDEDGSFYFMEMNTRIQVEHPVTELVTGHRPGQGADPGRGGRAAVAHAGATSRCAGTPSSAGSTPRTRATTSAPVPARSPTSTVPAGPGARWTRHAATPATRVPPYYDSLIAKLIVYGARPRRGAIATCARPLDEFIIEGVKTTIPSQRQVMQ